MQLEILYHDISCGLIYEEHLAGRAIVHQDDYFIFHDGLTKTAQYVYVPGIGAQAKAAVTLAEPEESKVLTVSSPLDSAALAALLGVSGVTSNDVIALRKEGLI